MAELSVLWLRIATVLYSIGLLHAIVTIMGRREPFFRAALWAFYIGLNFHLVSIVDEAVLSSHFPVNNFWESMSLVSLLIAALFLYVCLRYKLESLSVFIFPLVFVMTLVATLGNPVAAWSSAVVRNVWLTAHVVLVLLGYAALVFTAVAALVYLFQERVLKKKKPRRFSYRMPALGTLDELISKAMALGFIFITLGIITGSTWAFIELGTRWVAEPKIAISFVTWGIYMAMVFLRMTAGWRGRKAAIMVIAVLCCSAITWAAHAGLRSILSQ